MRILDDEDVIFVVFLWAIVMVFTECSLHALPGWKNIVPERTYLALDSILRNSSSATPTILPRFILSRDKKVFNKILIEVIKFYKYLYLFKIY